MSKNNLAIAEAYYTAMREKNTAGMEKHLHPDVQFIGPFAELKGKKPVLEGAVQISSLVQNLTIRSKFGSGDQAMLAYELDFPAPIGNLPVAALMTFKDGLIAKIELYFDGRRLEKKK